MGRFLHWFSKHPEGSQPQKERLPFGKERLFREVRSIFVIVIFVFAFRSVFFEPFRIPSGSMIPTLMIGDFILVNKLAYGFKVPFSDMYSDPIYLYQNEGPKRGEVIVFKYPKDESFNYIKRVVGVPGDRIEVIDKVLYINNTPIETVELSPPESKEIKNDLEEKFRPHHLRFFQTKTGEFSHKTTIWEHGHFTKSTSPIVVPEGKYFVMGDNRDFSSDSRVWGLVDHRLIKGRAFLVWFSLNPPNSEMGHEFKFRPWRIGTSIHKKLKATGL
ncbi:MAG: signal peptidase I [Bacteriovoracales bacterium]|nr:signal peptidase I [Bacteriovoracales bacterium]